MLLAIQSIYKDVKYCVNGLKSKWFDVSIGLRQGCLLSPMLFNLYINDLAREMKELNVGVMIDGGEKVCLLLYADDLCLIADNERDFQAMLNVLSDWCGKWRMTANVDKTTVVHFRPLSILRMDTRFTCSNSDIHIVDRYKYLGLILSEHLDYHFTTTMVAQAASQVLGLLIAKDKAHGGMPFICYSKLYDSLVQPVISYGAPIWATKDYTCIAAVQNRACRYYMGLGKYAPNTAREGDTGWVHPSHRIWKCVTRQWCRNENMCERRVNKSFHMGMQFE